MRSDHHSSDSLQGRPLDRYLFNPRGHMSLLCRGHLQSPARCYGFRWNSGSAVCRWGKRKASSPASLQETHCGSPLKFQGQKGPEHPQRCFDQQGREFLGSPLFNRTSKESLMAPLAGGGGEVSRLRQAWASGVQKPGSTET